MTILDTSTLKPGDLLQKTTDITIFYFVKNESRGNIACGDIVMIVGDDKFPDYHVVLFGEHLTSLHKNICRNHFSLVEDPNI